MFTHLVYFINNDVFQQFGFLLLYGLATDYNLSSLFVCFLLLFYFYFLFLNMWFLYWFVILRSGRFYWRIKRVAVRAMEKMRRQKTIHQHQFHQPHIMKVPSSPHRKFHPVQQILQHPYLELGNNFFLMRYALDIPESSQDYRLGAGAYQLTYWSSCQV